MEPIYRYVWPIRLAFLGTIALFYLAPWVGVLLLAMVGVPISFHYLIRWSQSQAKSSTVKEARTPLHDLALIFATAPAIWLAQILDASVYGHEPQLVMVALWLWFQFVFVAAILVLLRRQLLPGPGDSGKIAIFFIPWILLALFLVVACQRQAWRGAFLPPLTRLACLMVVSAAALAAYLIIRLRPWTDAFSRNFFARSWPRPDSRVRFFIGGFALLPLLWGLFFVSLCLHWHAYLASSSQDTVSLAPRLVALHQALMEVSGMALAFGFPVAAGLVWWGWIYRMNRSPSAWQWLGVFLPWGLLLLAIAIDPGGWFGWTFE